MAEAKKSGVLEEYWLYIKLKESPRGKVNMVKKAFY
jgi:hypothetical protein